MAELERFQLTSDLSICRVLNGLWQVSGGHGPIAPDQAIAAMFDYQEAGFITWDVADHYGPAEDFIGEFRRQWADQKGKAALAEVQCFTKWFPTSGKMTRELVENNINVSRARLGMDCLDLLQFHWSDYQNQDYLEALHYLSELQAEGKIKHLALTNFDTEHLKIVTEAGIKIISNQVQFSLIDRRPLIKMIKYCQQQNIQLLAYGTLAGGLLSDKYLGYSASVKLNTASLRKYHNIIQAWGGWPLLQQLLGILKKIADKHQVSIANVAIRYVLEQPMVAGAILGVRLGITEHRQENAKVFSFRLDEEDYQALEPIWQKSRNLYQSIGDCGDEYRR
jgi:aryl-alcohol dehydrogenase-like predicted oxidoreductase